LLIVETFLRAKAATAFSAS